MINMIMIIKYYNIKWFKSNKHLTTYNMVVKNLFFFTFFLLPLTHGAKGLEGLNIVRCGTCNVFGLSDEIQPSLIKFYF